MKQTLYKIAGVLGIISMASCADLDLNPRSAASSENCAWQKTESKIRRYMEVVADK